MVGPLSVTLSHIHMIRMETDVVVPVRLIFYKRYTDDIYNRRQKNTSDALYDALNNYQPKIKLSFLKGITETPLRQNYIVQSEFHQILQVR